MCRSPSLANSTYLGPISVRRCRAADALVDRPSLPILPDRADRTSHGGSGAGQADKKHVLLPDLPNNVCGEFGVDASLQAGMQKGFGARRPAAIELAEDQALHRSRLPDDTRAIDRSRNVADPAHDLGRVISVS